MECTKCGKINYANANTCVACGYPLHSHTSTPSDDEVELPEPVNEDTEDESVDEGNDTVNEEKKAKRKKKIFIVLGVFLAIGLVIAILAIFPSKPEISVQGFVVDPRFHPDSIPVNQLIEFRDTTPGATSWQWDFHNEDSISFERIAHTTFTKEGKIAIKLLVDGKYEISKDIIVIALKGPPLPPRIIVEGWEPGKKYRKGDQIIIKDVTPEITDSRWYNETEKKSLSYESICKFEAVKDCKIKLTNSLNREGIVLDIIVYSPPPQNPSNSNNSNGLPKQIVKLNFPENQFKDMVNKELFAEARKNVGNNRAITDLFSRKISLFAKKCNSNGSTDLKWFVNNSASSSNEIQKEIKANQVSFSVERVTYSKKSVHNNKEVLDEALIYLIQQ